MVAKGREQLERYQEQFNVWGRVFKLSAWGFVIVIASFAFLYIGYKLDILLGTAPNFMLGLFLLATVTSVGRLFSEAWQARQK